MIRDRIVVALGNFVHGDHEFLDFLGLCFCLVVIAFGVTL